ncbi:hypothetical protein SAY87_003895 [Trapa incisa]|uniref:Zinc finger protein n=1 Tax=Trapa incisa TaxID=236973 RepID=A0AAN7JNZ4_9MYRT|nr:hypothetical protein SAY87_003895 [Trapa incisa]
MQSKPVLFPLQMKKFSSEEQAPLVWQFLCSVPIMILESILPWMISFLSPEERDHLVLCIKDTTVHKEEPLQKSVTSWLRKKYGASSAKGLMNMKTTRSCFPCSPSPVWYASIMKDFKTTLEELHQLKTSKSLSNLQSVIFHLKFLADILAFYCNALDQLYYPVLSRISQGSQLPSLDQFMCSSQIEELLRSLGCSEKYNGPDPDMINKIFKEPRLWEAGIARFFAFHEAVFDRIFTNCSVETKKQLLYLSIRTLPLGLLKCAVTCFSGHLAAEESASILPASRRADSLEDRSFTLLINEWFRVALDDKTTLDKFQRDLQGIIRGKFFRIISSKQVEEVNSKRLPRENFSSCSYMDVEKTGIAYSSRINWKVGFPVKVMPLCEWSHGKSDLLADSYRKTPIDILYYFLKALKNDLERLVLGSLRLTEDPGLLHDFQAQFRLFRFMYEVHSDAEKEAVFPALEEKGLARNIRSSYTVDHRIKVEHLKNIASILDKMPQTAVSLVHHELCTELQGMCQALQEALMGHIHRKETGTQPLLRSNFSLEEQEKIAGSILGRTRSEILQDMIPWLIVSLSPEEYQVMINLLKNITRNTMFSEWLEEWWDRDLDRIEKPLAYNTMPSSSALEIISTYLSKDALKQHERNTKIIWNRNTALTQEGIPRDGPKRSHIFSADKKSKDSSERVEKGSDQLTGLRSTGEENLSETSQEELEAAIRRVSRDSSLDPQKKSYIIQNLLTSRWIILHQKPQAVSSNEEDTTGFSPSYRDPGKLIYGCKHYRRKCKLLASCCNKLFTCGRCHDEVADHTLDRKSITEMVCMKCLVIQPIGRTCTTPLCKSLSMGRYYCPICKIFDDDREIYHCPYCNLCRVGKGLGMDYFHCMTCNACMSRSLASHVCREKCFEDYCPICHDYIFTSPNPVRGLPCGHLMHSACFRDCICSHYTCPICSKSLGDMQAYFQMLDTLLAGEEMPDEYVGRTQAILCNDCEKKGSAPFHWVYHKCPYCGSYNTRLL